MKRVQLPGPGWRSSQLPGPGWRSAQLPGPGRQSARQPEPRPVRARVPGVGAVRFCVVGLRFVGLALRPIPGSSAPSPPAPPPAALALPAGPAEAVCALCQRAPREPVRADCGHRFCRACVVRFWAEEDGPFPCPECADDCWQRAVEPGRPPLSRRLLALEEAAAAPARDGPASEAALQLLCRADGDPLCSACRMAAGPEPPEWEPRWRKALRGKVRMAAPHTTHLCALLTWSQSLHRGADLLFPLPHPMGAQNPPHPESPRCPPALHPPYPAGSCHVLESWSP